MEPIHVRPLNDSSLAHFTKDALMAYRRDFTTWISTVVKKKNSWQICSRTCVFEDNNVGNSLLNDRNWNRDPFACPKVEGISGRHRNGTGHSRYVSPQLSLDTQSEVIPINIIRSHNFSSIDVYINNMDIKSTYRLWEV